MAKKSYDDLTRQLETLMAQRQEMEQKAVKSITDAIMKEQKARETLAKLSSGELQAVARLMAASVDSLVAQVQADKAAKAAEQPQEVAQSPAPDLQTQY